MRHTFTRAASLALSAAMAATLLPAAPLALADGQAGTAGAQDAAAAGTVETPSAVTVTAAIDALPELAKATRDDAEGIQAAYRDYTALDATQKALVPAKKAKKLTALDEALSAAEKVEKRISALPSTAEAKASDYATILKVAKAYGKLAQKAFVRGSLARKIAKLETTVYYSSTPVPSYRVKRVGSSKAVNVADGKAHSFKAGIGKVKVFLPKSGYNGKTRLAGSLSYGVKVYAGKNSTTKKSTWVGSTSKSKTVQALKLKFGGTVAKHYTVWYRVKVKKLGWSGWASNGAWAGSTHMALRLTGLQVKFVKKGAAAPGSTAKALRSGSSLSYRVNRVKGGWTGYRRSGATAGTASWNAGIKQVQVKTSGGLSGKAEASVLTRAGSWTAYTAKQAGSASKSRQAQAVRIRLTGELAKVYNVYYRVYASDHHWLGWAKNGQKAGTQGHKYPMGAIQVRLVLKGKGAPGSTGGHFTTKAVPSSSGGQLTMTRKAQRYSSSTGWLVLVNRNTTHVGVFKGSKNDWTLVRYMLCDVGAYGTPTPKGTRHVQYRIPSFGEDKGYSVYKATNIGGGYYFHSILYYANTRRVMDGTLGAWCSHGCIRLSYANASYIHSHVPNGTTVKIY